MKKTLSIMLALIMAVGVIPMAVLADEVATTEAAPVEEAIEEVVAEEAEEVEEVAEEAVLEEAEEAVLEEAEEAVLEEAEEVVEEPAEPATFTVTFDINYYGASKKKNVEVEVIEGEAVVAPEFKRIGWMLKGWATKDEDGKLCDFDITTPITADTVLYAVWQKIPPYCAFAIFANGVKNYFPVIITTGDIEIYIPSNTPINRPVAG